MSTFKERLSEEKAQLEDRLNKLSDFIHLEGVTDKSDVDVQNALLHIQVAAMNTYLQCLKERIEMP
jgi:hypothetical protein